MPTVSDEDKEGFINLNVRVHRDDILDALDEDADDSLIPHLSKKEFKRICQKMADKEPFSGGDIFNEACRDAYEAVME
jgi:hypothetical protein